MARKLIHKLDFAPDTARLLLSADAMRACEQAAFASGTTSGLALMEIAGHGVVDAFEEAYPDSAATPGNALVLCGPGNNGGDGYVIARTLAGRGWDVEVLSFGPPEKLKGDAAENRDRWLEIGAIMDLKNADALDAADYTIVFDAVFGTGLARPIGTDMGTVLNAIGAADTTIIAVDLPSGLHTDSGKTMMAQDTAHWPRADMVVTFQRAKPAHVLSAVCHKARHLCVVDLGIAAFEPDGLLCPTLSPTLLKSGLDHKYQHGHAAVLAGGYGAQTVGVGGAGRLAARSALRIGAGAVTLLCPPGALLEHASHLSAVMTHPIKDTDALAAFVTGRRISSLCAGPGLGLSKTARELTLEILSLGLPAVLDADALSNFAETPATLFSALHKQCVLTPHGAEFARLFPDLAERLQSTDPDDSAVSKIKVAQQAAERCGAVVLLKGAVTVIAAPDGNVALSVAARANAAPWLATAGSGDVLAGLITGLLARGFVPFEAATQGALLHVAAARAFGPGLIAEDLPEALANVLRTLENQSES